MGQNAETLFNLDSKEISTLFYEQIKGVTLKKQTIVETIEKVTIQEKRKVYHSLFDFLGIDNAQIKK